MENETNADTNNISPETPEKKEVTSPIPPEPSATKEVLGTEKPYNSVIDPFSTAPALPKRQYKLFEVICAIICFGFGFGFIKLFLSFTNTGRIGLFSSIFYLGFEALAFIYLKKSGIKFNLTSKVTMAIIALFCINLSISSNLTVKILDIIFIVVAICYWIFTTCDEVSGIRRRFFSDIMVGFFSMPFHHFGACFQCIASATKSKSTKNIRSVLIGLFLAIPVTVIVTGLLISSDAMFEEMFSGLLNNFNMPTFIIQFAFSIPITCFLFSMLVSNTDEFKSCYSDNSYEADTEIFRFISPITMCVSVTPICILYVLYFFAQSQYFLSAFNNTIPNGYDTYSAYAKRGFFELCAVCVINLIVIIAINSFSKREDGKQSKGLKVYNIILSIFTLILISTAMSKMFLYISGYGLTQKRVYTSLFMALLAVIFIIIIVKQFKVKMNIMKYIVSISLIFFAIFSFSNIDGFIMNYNLREYQKGNIKYFEIYELRYDLSTSAIKYVVPIAENCDDKDLQKDARKYLGRTYEYNLQDELTISNWNLYDYLALKETLPYAKYQD